MEYQINPPTDFIEVNESARIYHYPTCEVHFENVHQVCVRPSGSHRLNLADGTKIVVQPGWVALEIHGLKEWVF